MSRTLGKDGFPMKKNIPNGTMTAGSVLQLCLKAEVFLVLQELCQIVNEVVFGPPLPDPCVPSVEELIFSQDPHKISKIFLQTKRMRECVSAYKDLVLVDGTEKTNKYGMTKMVPTGVDGLGKRKRFLNSRV